MMHYRSYHVHRRTGVRAPARLGFTLVELLAVIAIIGVMVGMLIPAVQAAREAARRAKCMNNLHQISIAILNYESAQKTYPPGNINWPTTSEPIDIVVNAVHGHSWYVRILGFMDEGTLRGRLNFSPPRYGLPHYVSRHANMMVLRDHQFEWASCPSSPLPSMFVDKTGEPTRPSAENRFQVLDYAGISGSYLRGREERDPLNKDRMYKAFSGIIVDTKCIYQGKEAGHDDFCRRVPTFVTVASVRDGASNTLMLGEQSDFCRTSLGEDRDCRSNVVAHEGNKGNYHVNRGSFTMTTVFHPINTKDAGMFQGSTGAPNTSIQSPHPSGALMARADGSVFLMPETVDIEVLWYLCDKNDGKNVNEETVLDLPEIEE